MFACIADYVAEFDAQCAQRLVAGDVVKIDIFAVQMQPDCTQCLLNPLETFDVCDPTFACQIAVANVVSGDCLACAAWHLDSRAGPSCA